MNYIILDLEFNQAFPFPTGKKKEPVAECPFEIIQIGAVKLDQNLQQIATFDTLIQPKIYPRLHPYVEKITKISQKDLKNQPNFPDAFHNFLKFIGEEASVLCTWGGDDIKSLFRNILYYNLDIDAITDKTLNIQPLASKHLKYEAGKAIGLKNAITAFEMTCDLPFHNALNDAIYTARIFKTLKPQNIQPDIFQPLSMLAKKPKSARTNTTALLRHFSVALEKELTEEEKKMIKMAYALGKAQSFDISPSTGKIKQKKTEKDLL